MTFATSETGAVTVDWVVLTASLVGLGMAVLSVLSAGVQDTSGDIEDSLSSGHVFTSFNQFSYSEKYQATVAAFEAAPPGMFGAEDGEALFEDDIAVVKGLDDAVLLASISDWANTYVPQWEARNAGLLTLDESTATLEEVAPYFGGNQQGLESLNTAFGGDMEALIAFELANNARSMETLGVMRNEADERGLSY